MLARLNILCQIGQYIAIYELLNYVLFEQQNFNNKRILVIYKKLSKKNMLILKR